MRCQICKRLLNDPEDPFSEDCGGDCAMCMMPIEFNMGNLLGTLKFLQGMQDRVIKLLENEEYERQVN